MTSQSNIPSWINSTTFEGALRESVGDFKKIQNFNVCNALGPGENYATLMLRVQIEFLLLDDSLSTQSFMLKVPLDNKLYEEEMSKWDMFKKEAGMYRDVIPEMEELYRNKGVEVRFGAKSYSLPVTKDYILLEDLSRRGFRNIKRQNGLDMQHAKSSLKMLAQWHAASAVRVAQKGPYDEAYVHGFLIESSREITQQMFDCNLKHILAAARQLPHHEEYYGKMEAMFANLTDIVYSESSTEIFENEFLALNHGDFWCNNIMYQYDDEGNLKDTHVVDLQMPRFGSVAQDLMYFILSSTQLDLKVKRFDELVAYYHQQLVEHLKILEYSKTMPCLRDIHKSLIKRNVWGILTVSCIMAGVLCEPTNAACMDNFVTESEEGDDFRQKLFFSERYLRHLEEVLPWLNNRGAFDP
uniref:CHK kinase-like domain-containing protein n=2 Tax=Stomoxys calcitrans TaxID=35570 RepID=A0A1I8PQJ6_STOCA